MYKISTVIGYRDRDVDRIARCLNTLEKQESVDSYEVIVVDFGSNMVNADKIKKLVDGYKTCEYIYSDTQGLPWNRAQALNIGIRHAKGEYILTTDADMIFPKKMFMNIDNYLDQRSVLHLAPYYLPKSFSDWSNIEKYTSFTIGDSAQVGGFHLAHKDVYERLGGFDENYVFWGNEDIDISHREKKLGLKMVWLNDVTRMYHQWHKIENYQTAGFMPENVWGDMQAYFIRNKNVIVRNNDKWGNLINKKDRKVYEFLDFKNNTIIETKKLHWYEGSPYNNHSITEIIRKYDGLPTGHALAIVNAFAPKKSKVITKIIDLFNRISHKLGSDIAFQYHTNIVHSYLYRFIRENQDLVSDYYLGFPSKNGVLILVKS